MAAALLGAAGIAGWIFHVPALVRIWAGMTPMQFNTALGFVAAGIGMACSSRMPKLKSFTSALLLLIGVATLVEFATGLDLQIDQALFRSWLPEGQYPGRMGVNSAVCFTLLGLICGLSRLYPRKSPMLTLAGSMGVLSIAAAALIGYLTGMESAYRWGHLTRMAAHTAVGFLVLGAGTGMCGWRSLEIHRGMWLAVVAGGSAASITLMLWMSAVGDHRRLSVLRSETAAANVAHMTMASLDQNMIGLDRFADRWAMGCKAVPAMCERDLEHYFRDFPELISLAWVDSATGAPVRRRTSPGFTGQDPLATWRPAYRTMPFFEVAHSPAGRTWMLVALGNLEDRFLISAAVDPDVVVRRAAGMLVKGWQAEFRVEPLVVDGAAPQSAPAHFSASRRVSWGGRHWIFTVSQPRDQENGWQLSDYILLAGLTMACCFGLIGLLWQTSRERTRQIRTLNAELETKVADRTRDVVAANKVLQTSIEEEHRVATLLRQRESQLERTFHAGRIGTWSQDLATDQVVWNGKLKELYGLPADEAPAHISDFMQLVHPADHPAIRRAVDTAMAGNGEFYVEFRAIWPDGTVRWLATQGSVDRDPEGRPVRLEGINLDITARKQAEIALQQSEQQIRQLADALPQIVWTATPDGHRDYHNRRWYDYTGMSQEQCRELGWRPVLHPDDLQHCVERWTHAVTTGEPYEIEYRFRRASDGSYRWHLGRAVPVRDAAGRIVRWFGTATDIEDYKQAESSIKGLNESLEERVWARTAELATANQELVQIKLKLQSVLDAATQVAIVATDTQGTITVFNSGAERMLQYSAAEMVGVLALDSLHEPAECSRRAEELSRELGRPIQGFDVFVHLAREGGFEEREWTYIRKDGSRLEVSLGVTAVRDSAGAVEGFLGIAMDITARKTLERELRLNNENLAAQTRRAEEANRAKSDFLATMSHEIRTPMNAILGMAELLWESDLNAEQRHYVEVFRRAGSNLLALINDILDLSKIEAGHFELERVPFNLEEVVDQAVELVSPKARAKGIQLMSRLAPGVRTAVSGDPARLRQVLINLLGNAIKFTDAGEVVLSVEEDSGDEARPLAFSVSDTGIGIAADKLPSIFDNFTQADSSTTRRYGGTGLGLSISRRIVALMRGSIGATSKPGEGSTFRFVVPFEAAPGMEAVSQAEVEDLNGRRVIVFDDNATNRLILCEALAAWGLEAREFATPAAGIREIAQAMHAGRPYSLVLLDKCMPGMDGFMVASRIREISPSLPVVMLTSDSQQGDIARRQEMALAGYALKPVKRAELFRLVSNAIRAQTGSGRPEVPEPGRAAAAGAKKQAALRILVAEDAPDNRLLLQAYLKSSPHLLTFAEDGQSACDEFAAGRFDLVLMDVQMPRMDGLSASRAIRARERELGLKPTPILALTANARPEDIAKSTAAGCDGHLSKPISKQRLLAAIDEYGARCEPLATGLSDGGRIRIDIPEGLEDLLPEYLAGRRKELPEMRSRLAAGDFQRLRSLAHNMKGSGASYGFGEISRIGAGLEQSAIAGDAQQLGAGLTQLEEYLARVELSTP